MAFKRRVINVQITLGEGTFTSGKSKLDLTGLRTSVHITKIGGPGMNQMEARIWGLTPNDMNSMLTQKQVPTSKPKGEISISAGDADGGVMASIFEGNITDGWGDYSGIPDVPFVLSGASGIPQARMPTEPTSFKDEVDAVVILRQLADTMGLDFEDNDTSVMLQNPYLAGSPRSQVQQVAQEAGLEWMIDDGTLAIWRPGTTRVNAPVVTISRANGMIGYPAYTAYGMMARTLFNPHIKFGGKVLLETTLPKPLDVRENWAVQRLEHNLESETPNGKWETVVGLVPESLGPLLVPPSPT